MVEFVLTEKAYDDYRLTVKGNHNIPFDQATKKLCRNIHDVLERIEENPDNRKELMSRSLFKGTTYKYGRLHIFVRFGKIVNVKNYKDGRCNWKHRKKRQKELNKLYGILPEFTKSNRYT